MKDKVAAWLDAGTKQVWVVSPQRHTVAVHNAGSEVKVYHLDDTIEGDDILPGLALHLGDVFDLE